ncbi:MAG: S8 family serine peptidase [Pseudomonadota bacterium]
MTIHKRSRLSKGTPIALVALGVIAFAVTAKENQAAPVAVAASAPSATYQPAVATSADFAAARLVQTAAAVAPVETVYSPDLVEVAIAKMSPTVAAHASMGGAETVPVIVRYDAAPELFENERLRRMGGEVVRRFDRLGLLAVKLPAGALIDLAISDTVRRVSLDAPIKATRSAYKDTVGAPLAGSHNGQLTGRRVGVAVVDSGVARHGDLRSSIRQYDFVGGKYPRPEVEYEHDDDEEEWEIDEYNSSPRGDAYGHGTLVASLIAGSGKHSSGKKYRGLAPGAKLLSLRVLDSDGNGETSDAIAALNWLLEYGPAFNVRVANLSVGKAVEEAYDSDPLVAAVNAVWDSGITVVVAAGNHGRDGNMTVTSPGNSPKVITVGSLTDNGTSDPSDDYVSTYSSVGPTLIDHVMKPDLLAPGNRLVGAIGDNATLRADLGERLVNCDASYCHDDYLEMSGTSMATPVVAATAALMIQKNPDVMTPDIIKARLMTTARKIDGEPAATGAGVIDINAALDAVVAPALAAKSPKVKRKGTADAPRVEVEDIS